MGLGGDLIWTSVFRSVQAKNNLPIRLAYSPQPTDLFLGYFYDRSRSADNRPIFRHNPRVEFTKTKFKGSFARIFDRVLLKFFKVTGLIHQYYEWIYRRSLRGSKNNEILIDLPQHSYASKETDSRLVWRPGPHVIDVALKTFLPDENPIDHRCEIYWSELEMTRVQEVMKEHGLLAGGFVIFEPYSNSEYFGQLRAWPLERWGSLISLLKSYRPDLTLVQVGADTSPPFPGALSFIGRLSFRETAFLQKQARLFLGTEGGLIHAANAAKCPTVAIWGGVTRPDYAGYPEYHRIVSVEVPCSGCGLKGDCPYAIRCMTGVSVEAVFAEIVNELKSPGLLN